MSDVHRLVAEVGLGLALLAIALSVAFVVIGRRPGRLIVISLALVALAMVVAAGLGLILLVSGPGPHDPLHLLYGALSLVAIPATLVFAARRPARQQAAVTAIGMVVLALLVLRLFQTG